MTDPDPVVPSSDAPIERRDFIKGAACSVLGGACLLGPIAAGVTVLVQPLRLKGPPLVVKLSNLDTLPVGKPRLFQVLAERRDAWTQFPKQAVGAVFLLRKTADEVVAFNASCPHLGCAVEYRAETSAFYCPCHDSNFSREGDVVGQSPSLRGLDALEVEIRDREVWVKFLNFKTGVREKVAVS